MSGYTLFFSGLNSLIDKEAAIRLCDARQSRYVVMGYESIDEAVRYVETHSNERYAVCGFSRGASPVTLRPFMAGIRERDLPRPVTLFTVGLYGESKNSYTPRYDDPEMTVINYIDSSGQAHDGEPNVINLGASVPHLGKGSGMELVADMYEDETQ